MRQTVLIVDDNDGFRSSARLLLESRGFAVVGEASRGAQAVAEVQRLRPAIVLLDIQLPDMDGFAVAEALAAAHRPPIVFLISSRTRATYAKRLERAPARSFIAKHRLLEDLLAEIVP